MRGKVAKALRKQAVKLASKQKSHNGATKSQMAEENYRDLKKSFKTTPKHHQPRAF